MAAIYENLKHLRTVRGLTQEDVAKQLGVTRQTISSYESNRTQPDLETLKRLADIFQVSISDVLYGDNHTQKQCRNIYRVYCTTFAVFLLGTILRCAIRWTANRYFIVPAGLVAQADKPRLEIWLKLLRLAVAVESWELLLFALCCAVLLVMLVGLERPVPLSVMLKYWLILVVPPLLSTLPWSYFDVSSGTASYFYPTLPNVFCAALTILFTQIGQRLKNHKNRF